MVVEAAILAQRYDGLRFGELNDRKQFGMTESGSDSDQAQPGFFCGEPDEKQFGTVGKLYQNVRVLGKTQMNQSKRQLIGQLSNLLPGQPPASINQRGLVWQ